MSTDYLHDGQSVVRELRAGAAVATYLNGSRGPEYRRDDVTGQVRWYVYDGLGSVVAEVAPGGSVTSQRAYDVYGGVRGGSGQASTAHGFVGVLGHTSRADTA